MLELRPIIIDDDNVILGGNMRYRALEALGYTEIPDAWVMRASGLTDEQKREFLIKDNIGYGEWDFDVLFNEWDTEKLTDWGMDLPVMDDMRGELLQDVMKADHRNLEDFYRPVFFSIVSFETEAEREIWENENKDNLRILR